MTTLHQIKRLVILISGSGSNLQAIIDAIPAYGIPAQICAVISNRVDAFGLTRARQAGIPTDILDHKQFSSREAFDEALSEKIDAYQPDYVILAGFMRILTEGFVTRYSGRMINIHPSLLPKFQGLHTHRRAIEAAEQEHGATVHFVTPELDGGPCILKAKVTISDSESETSLAEKFSSKSTLSTQRSSTGLLVIFFPCRQRVRLWGKCRRTGRPLFKRDF